MNYEIIIDHGETANKCTILPLAHRPDFSLIYGGPLKSIRPLTSQVLLHHEGDCLGTLRTSLPSIESLAVIDCVWRRLNSLIGKIEGPLPCLAKIPSSFLTAYPRRNLKSQDPDGGLATIEALFIARALLGQWDETLLEKYYFADLFLEMNRDSFSAYGLTRHRLSNKNKPRAPRDASTRRQNRGRISSMD